MTSRAERIDAGIAMLDDNYPGWENRIDLDLLDVRSLNCVLGQVYGSYMRGKRLLNVVEDADQCGFDICIDADESYADLTSEWRRRIEQRRRS